MIGTPLKASATNGVASVTVPARGPDSYVEIRQIIFSLSATPAAAVALTVESPSGTTIMDFDILGAGAGPVVTAFRSPTKNADVIVKLAAGGSGVVGKLNVTPCE